MGAFTISCLCEGCGAEINRFGERFGCRVCWETRRRRDATFCQTCAEDHPNHGGPPKGNPDLVVLSDGTFKVETTLAAIHAKLLERLRRG